MRAQDKACAAVPSVLTTERVNAMTNVEIVLKLMLYLFSYKLREGCFTRFSSSYLSTCHCASRSEQCVIMSDVRARQLRAARKVKKRKERDEEAHEIARIEQRIAEEAPARGVRLILVHVLA